MAGPSSSATELLIASAPPTVAVTGLPLRLTLASALLAPDYVASLSLSTDQFVVGQTLTINGVSFTAVAGPDTVYGEFVADAGNVVGPQASLIATIEDSPLAADYYCVPDSYGGTAGFLQMFARRPGPAWNTVQTVPAGIFFVPDSAPARVHGEQIGRPSWGCYVEIYAYPLTADRNYPVVPSAPLTAVLLTRLELPFSEENAYTFDLAPWLHAVVESTGRAIGYYVQYGQIYASPTNPYRRRHPAGQWPSSGVAWAFDAALPISSYADPREPQFLTPYFGPRPLCVDDADNFIVSLSAVCDTAGGLTMTRTLELADGSDTLVTPPLHYSISAGGVFNVSAEFVQVLVPGLQTLVLTRSDDVSGQAGGALRFELPASPPSYWLQFRNRLGGLEQWGFTAAEPGQTRTAAFYDRADGTTQTRRVDLTQSKRLTSGLLTRAAFDFLCAELAASSDVATFVPADNAPLTVMNVTDFDAKADVLTEEYSISLTITPRAPFTPLTR